MSIHLTSKQVWNVLKQELFAVLGMVTAQGEARTVGIVYIVSNHRLYIATGQDTWKARHVGSNPHVSLTVPIARRIPFLPWIKIPQATITFSGLATVHPAASLGSDLLQRLLRGYESNPQALQGMVVLEIEPQGEFVTYGIGIPLMKMRFPEQARGRAPVEEEKS